MTAVIDAKKTKIDIDLFRKHQEQGWITGRTHPTEDLVIWNYTPKCVYEPYWNDVTEQARGLITTSDGTVIARPFRKFWNIDEKESEYLPNEPFTVTAKEDGSLGVLFQISGKPQIATRGSFTSEQAIRANKILQEKYSDFQFDPALTYLFEIIFPENKIVISYGDREDLILLAVIEMETGREIDIHQQNWPFPVVKRYNGIKAFAEIKALGQDNMEGFVIRFESGLRVKCKLPEYVRLHKLMFGTTTRTIWMHLKDNRGLSELLDRTPPEFERWVKKTSKELSDQYRSIYLNVNTIYKEITKNAAIPTPISVGERVSIQELETFSRAMKKHVKEQFSQHPDIEHFLLMLYAGQVNGKKVQLSEEIWKALYPAADRPYLVEEEIA